jgi:hypothetical protein
VFRLGFLCIGWSCDIVNPITFFFWFCRFEDDVIEERRKCAISLLEFIGDHPALFTSNIFVKFLEVTTLQIYYYSLVNFNFDVGIAKISKKLQIKP